MSELGHTNKQEAHQSLEQAKRRATEIRPKAVGDGIFDCFSNFDECRPEVADDAIISGLVVELAGMDVPIKLGDSTLNSGRTHSSMQIFQPNHFISPVLISIVFFFLLAISALLLLLVSGFQLETAIVSSIIVNLVLFQPKSVQV